MPDIGFQQPLPIVNEDSAPYWEACSKDRLVLQQCQDCSQYRFPPQHLCPQCWSDQAQWKAVSGHATVYTFGVVRHAIRPDWRDRVPYVVALVELDEGPKMLTNVVECGPEEVAIGMPVEVVFDHVSEGIALPKFRPRAPAGDAP